MRRLLLLSAIAMVFSGFAPINSVTQENLRFAQVLKTSGDQDCTLRLSFQIGKTHYWRNGLIKGAAPDSTPPMGTSPEIKNKRTFLIIRPITAEVGAKLEYWKKGTPENPAGQDQVRITTRDGKVIDLWIGNPTAKINGAPVDIDPTDTTGKVAPYIKGKGYTMLPLRFVGDNLGATVNWIASTQTAELIFTDGDCLRQCCKYELKPSSELILCPGEQKLVELSLTNLCTTKKVTFSLTPKSGIISIDQQAITLDPNGKAFFKAAVAMPEKISERAEFSIGVSTDCGLAGDATFEALFSQANCRQACGWICGCIMKIEDKGDKVSVLFDEDCDGLSQGGYSASGSLKDLMLGMGFSDYIAKHGIGSCADLCIGEGGEITAWKARPNRKTCCQERILLTIELIDCEREIAIGVDAEGITWVLDLAGKKLCATLVPGQCYDVGGSQVKPVGTGFVTSKLLKVDHATAMACAGKTVCGTVKAKNCRIDPPLLMLETPDGQTIDLAVVDSMVRSQDGKFIECSEIPDEACIHASGYDKDGVFQALSVDILPCPCGKDFLTIDCRIASVVRDSKGELTVHAKRDCNGDTLYLTAPATLGDDFGRFRNLQVFSWIGQYARLIVDGGRIIRWVPRKGCKDCSHEELVTVLSSTSLGERGFLMACKNSDGMLIAVRSPKDFETGGMKLSSYRGSAKLEFDGLGMVSSWRMLDGPCCDGQPETIIPQRPAIIASSQSAEVLSEPKPYASAIMAAIAVETRFAFKTGLPPYPWNGLERFGARWIEPPPSFKGEAAVFVQDFCLPVCTDVDLQVQASVQTSIYLDKVDPMNLFGQAKGISHVSTVRATVPAGDHKLFFIQATREPGLIYAMTGMESGECKPCAYQVSMLTDPGRSALCAGQRKTYVARVLNLSQTRQVFKITPAVEGIVVNPASIMVPSGSEEIFEVTVMMPSTQDGQGAGFACLIEPDCGKAFQWSFEVPSKECGGCALSPDSTLIRLPAMCGGDKAKIEVKLENSCDRDQFYKVSSEDSELAAPATDFTAKSGESSSFVVGFTMPRRGASRFFAGSFAVRTFEGAQINYDVYAPFKDDCCCDYEVELQTRFVAEQTMKPGDRFTYDYLIKNKCQSRRMSFAASLGANVIKITPESFTLEPGSSQPMQVTVEMPKKTSDYADFSFAIKSDCGKQLNTAFKVKYAPISACCDYVVGIITDLPQPFMMEPGQSQMLVMGVENRCKTVTLTARISALDNVTQVDPTTINIDPGKIASFRMVVKMPECREGDKTNFRFRVAIDGCDTKEYSVPVYCGKTLSNCCDVGIADAWNELAALTLCPGETKSVSLALVNKCNDKSISGGSIYGDRDLDVDPGSINLKPGGTMKIIVTVHMPTDVKPGQEYTYVIHVNIPGCPSRQFRFKVRCRDCGGAPGICCDYEVIILSGFPACVNPGQTFEIEVEIHNKCPNDLVLKIGGTYMVPKTVQVTVPPMGRVRMKVKVQAPDCQDQFHLEIFFSPIIPQECGEYVKKIDGMIRCCQ